MENMDYINIRNMIRRIGAESETPEDMVKLLLSEIKAYKIYTDYHHGDIKLYDTTCLDSNSDKAIIGETGHWYITLSQGMVGNELVSQYCTLIKL